MIRIFALLLLVGGWFAGASASAAGKGKNKGPVDATLAVSGTTDRTEAFIKTGELVAERSLKLFKANLMQTYGRTALGYDERNLMRLYLRCDRNWGATAYALALQASSKESLRVVLMNYDAAGRDWERTALAMGKLSPGKLKPIRQFGTYLKQQTQAWNRILENPMRWRETYLAPSIEGR